MARTGRKNRYVRIVLFVGLVHIVCRFVGSAAEMNESRRVSMEPATQIGPVSLPANEATTASLHDYIETSTHAISADLTEEITQASNKSIEFDETPISENISTWLKIEMNENTTDLASKSESSYSSAMKTSQIPGAIKTTTNILLNETFLTFRQFIGLENQAGSILREVPSSCLEDRHTRICSCASGCTLQHNCCYDSDYVDRDSSSSEGPSAFSCFTNLNSKWWLYSPVTLMGQCPQEWPNDEIRQKCSSPSPGEAYENIPCHSNTTGLNYRNVYCHHCNGESQLTPWRAEFTCGLPKLYEDVDSMEKMLTLAERPVGRRGCRFIVSPPDHTESSTCVQTDIAHCEHKNTDDLLHRACLAYYNPVFSSDETVYRNIHCLKCNSDVYVEGFENIGRHNLGTMSVSLNINPVMAVNPLTNDKLSICGEDKVFNSGECEPIVKEVRGYYGQFSIHATVEHLTNEAPKQLPYSLLREFSKRATAHLVQEFSKFTPKVITVPLSLSSTGLSYRISLLFRTGHLLTENLRSIRETVESTQFTFDYENSLRVTCCNDGQDQSDRRLLSSAGNQSESRAATGMCDTSSSNPPNRLNALMISIFLLLIFRYK